MDNPTFHIRTAEHEDSRAIIKLLKSQPGVWQNTWRVDVVERAIASARDLAFVAVENNEIVGFISGHDVGFRAYLSEFVIAQTKQRAGIGKALIKVLESALAQRECKLIIADVYPPAQPFYTKQGWNTPASLLMSKRL